jgi:hypothetical protein
MSATPEPNATTLFEQRGFHATLVACSDPLPALLDRAISSLGSAVSESVIDDTDLLDIVAPADVPTGGESISTGARPDVKVTAGGLGVELPDLDGMPRRLRTEVEASWSLA